MRIRRQWPSGEVMEQPVSGPFEGDIFPFFNPDGEVDVAVGIQLTSNGQREFWIAPKSGTLELSA